MKVRESQIKYIGEPKEVGKVSAPEEAGKFFSFLQDEPVEKFCVLCLNNKNAVAHWQCVSMGTINETIVHPREVFRPAVMSGAKSIILCHNHPSGNIDPSEQDMRTTEKLQKAGDILGIDVLDHIIIGGENYFSMAENGYM